FMDLILGFLAGALTLINPCVLPVLPVVLASAGSADRRGPLFLMAGMSASFVTLGLLLARLGPALGVTPEAVAAAAALVMAAFGLVLLLPALGARFATATAGIAARPTAASAAPNAAGRGGWCWAACCWGPSGRPASGRRWAGPSRWRPRAAGWGRRRGS